jgi:hypothetical protein
LQLQFIPYLLACLLILLFLAIAGYFMLGSRALERKRLQQRDNQAERERLAEQRMVKNGGHPVSARPAVLAKSFSHDARSGEVPKAPYPEGRRRPGHSAGFRGWK